MLVEEHTRKFIKKNAKAIIGSDGLMGNKIVLIIPGTPGQPALANNDIIETARLVSMDEILQKIKVTSDNAANLTGDLSAIMGNIREGKGTIGKLFMDSTFAKNLDKSIVNIKQGAGGFKQNMEAAKSNFLFRGYYNRQERRAAKKKKEDEAQKAKDINNNR
jgi:phospholipid/cholesterol/gamma-HCH transport system substrate-binding protein